jgi:hypothetical protein
MRRPSLATIAAVATLALASAFGGTYYLLAHEAPVKRRPWPKPTPPPPASPIYEEAREPAPTEEQIELDARTRSVRITRAIELALVTRDPLAREAVFTFLLPELLQVEPRLAVDLFEAQRGEPRDVLRTEIARQWVSRDRDAAIDWMKTLGEDERRASAQAAVRTLGPVSAEQALYVAEQLDVGRDAYLDGLARQERGGPPPATDQPASARTSCTHSPERRWCRLNLSPLIW